MGWAKNKLIEEEIKLREAMRAMPERIEDALIEITDLRDKLNISHEQIGELRKELSYARSLKGNLLGYLLSGLIGAVLGGLLSFILP